MRRALKGLLILVLASMVCSVVALGWLFGPYILDDWRLDWVVRAVALDWRDFGSEKARIRLQYELDHQHIGGQVTDDSCRFEEIDATRTVRCNWAVDVRLPGTNALSLSLGSGATIAPDGDLR